MSTQSDASEKYLAHIHPLITIAFGLAVLGISAAVIDVSYSIVIELAKDTSWRN